MNAQLVLENVGVRLPSRLLFEGVNWTLYEGMRVALAGRNGSGKSTLLRIMAGRGESSVGQCTVVGGKNLRVGFLDQTLLDKAVVETHELKEQSLSPIAFIEKRLLKARPESEHEETTWEIRKILGGLGFSEEWMQAPINRLSGGWLLRLFIGAALLEKPEVLLLDEPTNHLDLASIQWLEEFLVEEYQGSLILITHDVALQKRVTESLAILHGGKFYFRTHQQDYLTFRESLGEEKRQLEKGIESIQRKIAENMEFFQKFRAKAQTAARAQSKLKAAEVLGEEMREMQDRLQRVEGFAYNLNFRFRMSGPGSKFPLSLKNVSFRYGEDAPWILKDLTFDIKRGQKIAIIGDNGAGKTTLLNVIADRLKPTNGELMPGHGVTTGYFGQHQLDELMLDDSVLDNLRACAVGVSIEEIRGMLGAFGFIGNDEIGKKAKVLSGGERARLALLRILMTRINFVLLDEPTNHLDIETKDLLKQAIREFEGAAVFVSHDREFIEDVADRIIYLSSDHKLTDHFGDLKSFFDKYPHLVRHIEGHKAKPSTMAPASNAAAVAPAKPKSTLSFEDRKKIKNQIRGLERKLEALEPEVEKLGAEKEELQKAANPDYNKLAVLEKTLTAKMAEWEKMSTDLEKFRAQQDS